MPLWHGEFIIRLCTALMAARQQCPREFDVWLGEYATSTKLWLVNALEGYCWRLAKIITRVDTALTQRDPDVPRDDITRLRTEQRAVKAIVDEHLAKISTPGRVDEGVLLTLPCVWRISAALGELTDMVAAFNTAHPPLPGDKPLAGPKLVPLVPMAPIRPGFMHVPCSLNVLNPAWLAPLGVDPEHHTTERMTREQLEALPPNIRRVLSVKTDGVAVDLTVQVGALPYVSRRASGNPTMKRKARERLGVDDADARPAPDPDAHLMGFDPGARALGGFFIRHPDGTTSSGVVPKCGYTKTPSFAFDMTPASFKSTNLNSLQNSIRFVLLHEQEIFDAGMVKSFRRVRLTNHILRQKHFHRAGEQLARTLGWTPRRLPRGIAPPRAAPTRLVVFYRSARFKTPRRVHPCAPYGRFAKSLAHIMRTFNITAEVRMTNEFRTSLVCPFCRARFRRTRYTRRTMRCHNPNCQGAPWYRQQRLNSDPTTSTWLNLSHRDKTAAQNILDCSLMTDAQYNKPVLSEIQPVFPTITPIHQLRLTSR
ncbi:hypothetical protein J8273_0384 [Carpediemonas membranifera]|uniref:Transposase n=1 Tax=Carpediemonas membranifera TaxID=201153 RepID=A0A8J6B6A2_9EUKA|nr:hypothetical protein J8273_0384 [Carpediemonas membranifera]|eukprot:KAG9395164.1 hypothetical protein J8273_0384 [Carpediemonas membranifera]